MCAAKRKSSLNAPQEVWVMIDAPVGEADVQRYSLPQKLSVNKLGEHLQSFASSISDALRNCKTIAGDFELSEVTLEAKLIAEFGFVLVSKAAVEGAISLKFARRHC